MELDAVLVEWGGAPARETRQQDNSEAHRASLPPTEPAPGALDRRIPRTRTRGAIDPLGELWIADHAEDLEGATQA